MRSAPIAPNENDDNEGKGKLTKSISMRPKNSDGSASKVVDKLNSIEEEEEKEDHVEKFRLALKRFMSTSTFGRVYETSLIYLSVLSCTQFVYSTYINNPDDPMHQIQLYYFQYFEAALSIIFGLDWILEFFMADHKLDFLGSFYSMIDLLTIIPIWFTYNTTCPSFPTINSFYGVVLYSMNALSTTRTVRALRIRKYLIKIEDEVLRSLGELILAIIVMLIFDAALMQFFEAHVEDQPTFFQDWIYYMWVTISTVGYGDIYPKSVIGQLSFICFISFGFIFVPMMTNDLLAKIAASSIYTRAYYNLKENRQHVIICGDLSSTSLTELFAELFHEDHENDNLYAVILNPVPPSREIIHMLENSSYGLLLTYIEGSALNNNDLRRCHADKAVSVFILTNKFSPTPDNEDAKTILQQVSIKRYVNARQKDASSIYCLQLLRPENRRLIVEDEQNHDLVVCLNEIKMGLFAKTHLFPGTTALIFNLVCSFADDEEENEEEDVGEDDGINVLEEDDDAGNWEGEYQRGCDWEIYTTEISEIFEGANFATFSHILYKQLGIVLFGIQLTHKLKKTTRLLLNPADLDIPSKSVYGIQGVVLAKNKASSDLSFNLSGFGEGSIDEKQGKRIKQLMAIAGTVGKANRRATSIDANYFLKEERAKLELLDMKQKSRTYAWQRLKAGLVIDEDSIVEKTQAVEELYLQINYCTREVQVSKAAVTIKTSITDEIPSLQDHMIIVGKELTNVFDLIKPLRAKYLGTPRVIVLLYPEELPESVWIKISIFEGIFIVRGSGLEENDLRRAGVFRAHSVIVLADANSSTRDSAGLAALADVDAIFTYQCVKRMNDKANIVVEIVNTSNIGYLDIENMQEVDYKFSPQFASGMLFTSSLLDTLVCQAFYNPNIVKVVNKLISGIDLRDSTEQSASAATGENTDQNSGGNNPNGQDQHGGLNKRLEAFTGSCLYQTPIPEGLDSRTYGSMYKYLCERGMVPLGLLRGIFPQTQVGSRGNKIPYVFTNPSSETELFSCDRVFVLSQKPPRSAIDLNWTKDVRRDLRDYEQRKERTLSDTALNALLSDLDSVHGNQKVMDEELGVLTHAVVDRFKELAKTVKDLEGTYKERAQSGPVKILPKRNSFHLVKRNSLNLKNRNSFNGSNRNDISAAAAPETKKGDSRDESSPVVRERRMPSVMLRRNSIRARTRVGSV